MIFTFISCVIVLTVLSFVMLTFADSTNSVAPALLGIIFGAVAGCSAIVGIILVFDWKASEVKAGILNREYGTEYTQQEVFYASSVIDTIRELNRSCVEINGDLLRK